jgi:hypothetical protein
MKSPIDLLLSILEESGMQCGVDTTQDRNTVLSRIKGEGDSFLTITLPNYLKSFYRALDDGSCASTTWEHFQVRGHVPLFLSGFMQRIFSLETARILDEPDLMAIQAVTQITGMFGKIERECTPQRVQAAFDGYVETEVDLVVWERSVSAEMLAVFRRASTISFGDVFARIEGMLRSEALQPHHGPGSTADKLLGNQKWKPKYWPRQLEDVFPMGRWAYTSWKFFLEDVDAGLIPEPGAAEPAKVIAVPKTPKGPRIISVEPTAMQYMQQGLLGCFENALQTSNGYPSVIKINNQVPNQLLAREGSLNGSLATLDLSEASDRVSAVLVSTMLTDYPLLREAVFAVRTPRVRVPGFEEEIVLSKYASMGSALTFAIEAIVFAILIRMAMAYYEAAYPNGLSSRSFGKGLMGPVQILINAYPAALRGIDRKVSSEGVAVFGDDIIVPNHYALFVSEFLEAYGLKVNRHKSFSGSNFRESCGKEYFRGQDVTYVKMRRDFPTNKHLIGVNAERLISTVSLRNLLFENGYWQTVKKLDALIEGLIPFPAVDRTSPCLGKLSSLGYETQRDHPQWQRPLVWGAAVTGAIPASLLDGHYALAKCLITASELPNPDDRHLFKAGRPVSLRIKKRWLTSY